MRLLLLVLFGLHAVLASQAQVPWTLDQCLRQAELKNLALRGSALQREGALVDRDQSKWAFLPTLNAAATHGYNWGQTIDRFTNEFATDRVRTNNFWLASDWTLFGGLSNWNTLRGREADALAADEAVAAQRLTIARAVVQRYVEMLSARARMAAGQAQVDRTRQQIALTEQLVEGGRRARVDLLDLRAQLAREEFDVVTSENNFQLSRLAMIQLLQLDATQARSFDVADPPLTGITPQEPTDRSEDVVGQVLAEHPAYKRAQHALESAQRSVSVAQAAYLPSLRFNASMGSGYSGRNFESYGEPVEGSPTPVGFTSGGETVYVPNVSYASRVKSFGDQLSDNLNYSTSWTLSLPVFNNMQTRTQVRRAQLRQEQARLDVADQRMVVENNVMQALTEQRAAFRQFVAASNSADAAEEAVRYAQERFAQGAIASIDLANAMTNLNRALADRITAQYNYVLASKSLDLLLGRPLAW
ncbi:MAG: TolC family protein [Flavobacteriales bacterium]|nr:TolC family protein [Flavobacteriales bacterium]